MTEYYRSSKLPEAERVLTRDILSDADRRSLIVVNKHPERVLQKCVCTFQKFVLSSAVGAPGLILHRHKSVSKSK